MPDQDPDYQSVVTIDEHNLDKECIRLPSDYLRFAHLSADAKRDADEANAKVKVVSAEMANEIRNNPGEFKIEKVTESAISAAVLTTERYTKATDRARRIQHDYDMAQAVVWALEHKKKSLTLLVELHGMGYFSAPKISRQGKEAVEEMTKKKVRRPDWAD